MLGIKINGEFLALKPGTSIEVERRSPFFAINDFTSEYSTPVSMLFSEKNALALGYIFQYYSERQKKKIAAELYDGATFRSGCVLVVETGDMNINRIEDAEITGYLLFGVSEFYSAIQDKKLSDLKLGGVRTFTWTTNDPDDSSGGFWQHVHQTWIDDSIPYVFYPVRNEKYYGENGTVEWMNKLDDDGKIAYDFFSPLVPMIRVKYLLEQIFKEFGYNVTFDLDDTDWQKLTLVNLIKVDWVGPRPVVDDEANTTIELGPVDNIFIKLSNHVPADKTISDFILQLFFRYGWGTVFNNVDKKVRIVSVKKLGKGTRKDWTHYAEPVFKSNFNQDKKIFAFTNDIDGNDSLPSEPDFKNVLFLPPVYSVDDLGAPDSALEGRVRFCFLENKWYRVELNEDTNNFEYTLFADNIYNYQPEGYTDTISTTISTLPIYKTLYRMNGTDERFGFFPMMEQEVTKDIGYRTLLYHGLVWETKDDGTKGEVKYPFASSTSVSPFGDSVLAWSNVYYHNKNEGASDHVIGGIIPYWWKDFLKILQAGEEPVFDIYIPQMEYNAYEWDDEILIANISYLVESITETVPFTGFLQATLNRLKKQADEPTVIPPVIDGNIYAQLVISNLSETSTGIFTKKYCDVVINLYADISGTIPYTPPTPLYVYVKIVKTVNNNGTITTTEVNNYYAVNGSTTTILSHASNGGSAIMTFPVANSIVTTMTYSLEPNGAYGYVIL